MPGDSLGSDRRVWITVMTSGCEELFVATVYLPVSAAEGDDSAWFQEVDGLAENLRCILGMFPAGSVVNLMIMGDINLQCSGIGGRPDHGGQPWCMGVP